jgi:hypothetical protein
MWDQEIDQWRQKLLSTREPTLDELDRLRNQERDRYLALCRALAWDRSPSIRLIALRQLGYYGERDDSAAEAAALDAAADPELRNAALLALGTVATPQAFPTLLAFAASGRYMGVEAAAKQARTPEQRESLVQLARRFVLAEDVQLRWRAVKTLRTFSTPLAEEQLLMEAARRYVDDFTISALGQASARVLPVLRALQSKAPAQSYLHADLSRAIATVQNRTGPTLTDGQ